MDCETYQSLCFILKKKQLLKEFREIVVEEQATIFLLTLSYNGRNHAVKNTFQHLGETINKYVIQVLKVLYTLGRNYIRRLNNDIPLKIHQNYWFYSYFKIKCYLSIHYTCKHIEVNFISLSICCRIVEGL